MIEQRLKRENGSDYSPFLLYLAYTPEPVVTELCVLRAAFEGEPPKEIIVTVTPA